MRADGLSFVGGVMVYPSYTALSTGPLVIGIGEPGNVVIAPIALAASIIQPSVLSTVQYRRPSLDP